ncbi:MAG: hypothetical protein QM528_09355 [Phycisphaerales bacterium]|nr:hypothetical protein [Phycisphaerales bacterium]
MLSLLAIIHGLLRWAILLLLIANIFSLLKNKANISLSKYLLIVTHTQLLIGLIEYFFDERYGMGLYNRIGSMAYIMKDAFARYWVVEHITGMLVAIVLITVGHVLLKKKEAVRATRTLYILSLIIILVTIPWPFRSIIGQPWLF